MCNEKNDVVVAVIVVVVVVAAAAAVVVFLMIIFYLTHTKNQRLSECLTCQKNVASV